MSYCVQTQERELSRTLFWNTKPVTRTIRLLDGTFSLSLIHLALMGQGD